jgi:hypothetical protein
LVVASLSLRRHSLLSAMASSFLTMSSFKFSWKFFAQK